MVVVGFRMLQGAEPHGLSGLLMVAAPAAAEENSRIFMGIFRTAQLFFAGFHGRDAARPPHPACCRLKTSVYGAVLPRPLNDKTPKKPFYP